MKTTNNFLHNLQVKLWQKTEEVTQSLSVKEKKFTRDMIEGIIQSKSCILRQIAQSHKEDISLEDTCKRYRRHLSKPTISDTLSDNHLQQQCRKINKDSLIIFDPSDLRKEYAKKMEGLSTVQDGSSLESCNGYNILDAINVDQEGDGLRISALLSELHTNIEAPGIMKQSFFDRINDIQIYSNNQGTFVMDRGYDDRKVFRYLSENDASFIIRAKRVRKLFYQGEELPFIEVAKKAKLRYRYQCGKARLKAGMIRVGIRKDPHPKKNPEIIYLDLVIGRYISNDTEGIECEKGYFYLFCNFPSHLQKQTNRQKVEKALSAYRIRWKIEEVHRQIKQDYSWEDMRVMKLDRLKALNSLLLIAVSFVYSLDQYKHHLALLYTHLMLDRKSHFGKFKKFIYYRLALVAAEIFKGFKRYAKLPYKGLATKEVQLSCF
jgi:hypothetical protein